MTCTPLQGLVVAIAFLAGIQLALAELATVYVQKVLVDQVIVSTLAGETYVLGTGRGCESHRLDNMESCRIRRVERLGNYMTGSSSDSSSAQVQN